MNKIIIANWKMNGSISLLNAFMDSIQSEDVILAVPNVFIAYAHFKQKSLKLAAQDCSVFDKFGAHTGEISADIIKEAGASYVILGHSERRATSGFDSVDFIYKKIENALSAGLDIVLCVDENYELLLDEKTVALLKENPKRITLAYEPLSAIGSGKVPSMSEIEDKINSIKDKYFGIKTLYGGSVNSKNINNILNIKDIDGVLIGGASLNLGEMKEILSCDKNV